MPDIGWCRRFFDDPMLVEGYANLLPLAPDDMTGNARAVRLKDEGQNVPVPWVRAGAEVSASPRLAI